MANTDTNAGRLMMRLQKYLADAGVASRRKSEELIVAGRVRVNGVVATIGCSVSETDLVELDGQAVYPTGERVVYAFYKPKSVICSSAEGEDRVKATDYFKDVPLRLYTVGRLDYDSEGLILVTNDGEFAERMTHPRYIKEKAYRALCTGEVTDTEVRRLRNGIELDDGFTAPAKVRINSVKNGRTDLTLVIHEGRNRQVRRMLAYFGHDTLRLCRIRIGSITLGDLKAGERRLLTREEIGDALR